MISIKWSRAYKYRTEARNMFLRLHFPKTKCSKECTWRGRPETLSVSHLWRGIKHKDILNLLVSAFDGPYLGCRFIPGTGNRSRISFKMLFSSISCKCAPGARIIRWLRTELARALTSSGMTKARPNIAARTWLALNKPRLPLGLAPK